jgi:transposase InsO family protein
MTDQQLLIRHRKVMIQARLMQSLSISKLCKQFYISHTTFYKWLNRYLEGGDLALTNKPRSPGKQPRQISEKIEMAILDFSEKHPAAGPQRISDELRRDGILVGKTAAYNALKRHKLNHKKFRYLRAQDPHIIAQNPFQREVTSGKRKSIKTKAPGYLLNIDTFYVGTIKGIGRIYQIAAIDTFSNFSWAKVYVSKCAKSACDFLLHLKDNTLERKISRILTDNGLEFTVHHKSKKHHFENLLKFYKIKHKYTKVRHPWTNGCVEKLNQTIYNEFYQVAFRKKIYQTLQQLQDDLDKFIDYYNFKRPNRGKRNKGKVPGEIYLLHGSI